LAQQPTEKRSRLIRGFAKSLRRGARFARKYLADERKTNRPLRILEVGAGDGYFSAGIKAEIPAAEIFLIDIVEDLVRFYQRHHECEPILGEFNSTQFAPETFDLLIFRDLLEHVRNPLQFLLDANRVLTPGGRVFFITPNGKEDFWIINQRFTKNQGRSLLLLNHFHYFLPGTLAEMLSRSGFSVIHGFKFGLKPHRRGLGWKDFANFEKEIVPVLPQNGDVPPIDEIWQHDRSEVRGRALSNLRLLSRLYSALVDTESERTGFSDDRGHEFFVIAQKQASPPRSLLR
jgi:2-polyprenyl-3-methyl-5-hydroxy-6-metoxy-1,4-benzoquinol methylase